jgi:flagellin
MRINTNVSSLTAQEAATNVNNELSASLEKLSSGLKINKAADDASGLAIADKLRTQATAINQAVDNGNSAVSLLQIADKSMAEQSNILDTIKAKLIQANTDTTSAAGRVSIAKDIDKLLGQLDNISRSTNYNGTQLIGATNGTGGTITLSFQVGESYTNGGTIELGAITSNSTGLGLTTLGSAVSVAGTLTAGSTIGNVNSAGFSGGAIEAFQDKINDAITKLNGYRGDIGSTQNQIESAVKNLMTQATNVKAAESVIRDVDYAEESANFNKQNIIAQAGSYAISQANNVQQNVLKLLQ